MKGHGTVPDDLPPPEALPDAGALPPPNAAPAWAQVLKEGAQAAWPICLGYFPIGLAFGVLAERAGLRPLEVGLMSLLVFAGSAQFIAVSMLTSGAAVTSIVITTFLVNLRHVLMSSSLAVHLQGSRPWFLSLYSYGITDESFAVNLTRFRAGSWQRHQALVVNHVSNAAWVLASILGGYCGQFIPAGALGIDYALVAMFLCLLVFQLRGAIYALTALVAGATAVGVALVIEGNSHVIVAAVVAATVGFLLKRRLARGEAAS
jgi:4-azaleucine resistance transporter AzlC